MPMILKAALMVSGGMHVAIPAMEGKVSTFGGPGDRGVEVDEMDWAGRFLCRDLGTMKVRDGDPYYIAMRWFRANDLPRAFEGRTNDEVKRWYCDQKIAVMRPDRARLVVCWVADYGPGIKDRVCDVGPEVLDYLEILTDGNVLLGYVDPGTMTGPYRLEGAGTRHAHFVSDKEEASP